MKDYSGKKNALLIERLCETFGALYQGSIIDKTWLSERFGVTERTAYRDLARLSHLLEEVSNGRYKLSSHMLPALHAGHLAEFASFAGVSHLFPYRDGPSLRKRMKNAENMTIQGASSRENRQFGDLMENLDKAISAQETVSFAYRSKSRIVQPYRLINHYGLWYLAGVEDERLKAFELARIERFAASGAHFSADEGVIEELNTTSGIHFGTRTAATLWVSAHAAQYVTRRALFPGQHIEQLHPDGSLTLTTAISDKNTLFRWLRYWLPDICILAPASLKEEFNEDFDSRVAKASINKSSDASSFITY
ncbi:WYL domain-containing protein [Enterobacteriaceae bacterium H18W14]|uniref:helix-turn-helix transcriptional regulator n=1 Tax=Dryocola boscaweniae TaxID=2925397 RepID=UPI0022F0B9A6|nr:WYL domain-containing protein [Dryocola boscaweniae]MCT4714783.1 WYL domain-containing protein [Dryocola boscaweniae]